MKHFIVLVLTFTLWLGVTFGEIQLTEYDGFADLPEYCENSRLFISDFSTLVLRENFIRSSLRCMEIQNSELDMIAGSFDGLPNLMYLALHGNRIATDQNLFSFGYLPSVRILKFGNVFYREHYISIKVEYEYPQLRYLDLSNTDVTSVEIYLSNPFPNITHLNVSEIRPSSSIFSFLPHMHTLTHLYASNNRQLNGRLHGMSNLLTLILDRNDFETIGKGWGNDLDLTGLANLVNLTVAYNMIAYISETAFLNTPRLRYLDLSSNYLNDVNMGTFLHLKLLDVLLLDDNSLRYLPFNSHLNITILSINCNNISFLSLDTFDYVLRLRKLFLNGNSISYLNPQTFKKLVNLTELHLRGNMLSYLSTGTWDSLKKLKYLDLSENKFTTLPHLAGCLATWVQFDHNPLEYVNRSQMNALPPNMQVFLNIGTVPQTKSCSPRSQDTSVVER